MSAGAVTVKVISRRVLEHDARVFDRRFLAFLSVFMFVGVMAYLFAVTFIPLTQTGTKYADIAVPLLLGSVIGGIVGFWLGASKMTQTPAGPPVIPVPVPGNIHIDESGTTARDPKAQS